MKSYLVAAIFCLTSIYCTLNAQSQVVKDSLSVAKIIGLNQKVSYGDYDVKFKKVITDSRCPKSVMCVRAGEADVLVSIYKRGKFIEDRKIRIDASGFVMETTNLAFNAEDFKIYGFGLTPYPEGVNEIIIEDYRLEVVFKLKRSE
ncbi:hypothetical protein [Winogradskyella pulchriflava]|uniref:Uncharacterized protein n=1 Tax=Winogradskyella pulchriflava TaxID=1110688 RepID=A0ABV6Q4V8_9FLAO